MTVNVKNVRFVLECLSWLLKISSTKRFLYNTISFTIDDIIEDTFSVKDHWFPKKEFAENFILAFA